MSLQLKLRASLAQATAFSPFITPPRQRLMEMCNAELEMRMQEKILFSLK